MTFNRKTDSPAEKLKGIKPFMRIMLTCSTKLLFWRFISRFSPHRYRRDKVLLFVPDANSITGSLGDVAMMTLVIMAIGY